MVAFDTRECPGNGAWEVFTPLAGRVAVGAGSGAGLTPREFGQNGGYEKLTLQHIPEHSHSFSRYDGDDNTGGSAALQGADADANRIRHGGAKSSFEGAAEPLESMPPFKVLTYCKRK